MMRKIATALLLAAAMALAGRAQAAEHVKLCSVRSFGGGPTMVAIEKGFFAKEGLDAEIVMFDSAQPIAVAVVSGDCDFGAAGLSAAFFNFVAQGTLKVIAAGTWEHAGFQSVGVLVSNQAYAAGLKGFKDMEGHSVGITQLGTPLQYYLLQLAAKYHVPDSSLRFLALQSNGVVGSAIAGGQADLAVQTAAPIAAVVSKGDGKLLGWTADELPPHQGEAVFTATKTANDRPAVVKAYLAGLRAGDSAFHDALVGPDGQRRESAALPEIIAIVAKYLQLPEATIRRNLPYFDPQARVAPADLEALDAWYITQHMVKTPVTAAEIVDMRYAVPMPK
ncbi:MAG TPA: ABC transporter substrate-binding protein [Stellaceae bacterium]|jgi:NitT/TauT family transport system substrate-binding protein|nr:ABC transporter substrate-binding protein [Stellaceae bacterium]